MPSKYDVTRNFPSYEALLAYAESKTEMTPTDRASITGSPKFTGTNSFEEAVNQARFGWPEGLAAIKEMSDEIWKVIGQKIKKQETFNDTSGAFVDIGAYLGGEPECMVQFLDEEKTGHGKIINITINVAASCGIKPYSMFLRGAAMVALADAICKLGYSVEVYLRYRVVENNASLIYTAPIKVAEAPLDQDKLAFALCSPSFLRRIMFSVMEHESKVTRDYFGISVGGGYAMPPREEETSEEGRGMFVPSMMYGMKEFETQPAACRWVLDKVKALLGYDAEVTA